MRDDTQFCDTGTGFFRVMQKHSMTAGQGQRQRQHPQLPVHFSTQSMSGSGAGVNTLNGNIEMIAKRLFDNTAPDEAIVPSSNIPYLEGNPRFEQMKLFSVLKSILMTGWELLFEAKLADAIKAWDAATLAEAFERSHVRFRGTGYDFITLIGTAEQQTAKAKLLPKATLKYGWKLNDRLTIHFYRLP